MSKQSGCVGTGAQHTTRCGSENLTLPYSVLRGPDSQLWARLHSSGEVHRCHGVVRGKLGLEWLWRERGEGWASALGMECWDSKWQDSRREVDGAGGGDSFRLDTWKLATYQGPSLVFLLVISTHPFPFPCTCNNLDLDTDLSLLHTEMF